MSRSQVPSVALDDIYQSQVYGIVINIADSTGPVDVSSSTFASQLRRYPSADVAATFGIDASAAATGTIQLSLTSAQTAALDPGVYRWDVDRIQGSTIQPLAKGEIIVEAEVTR
jgi:hypothetical protein